MAINGKYPTFTQAKKLVHAAGINTVITYRVWRVGCAIKIPYHPERHYFSEWINWPDFFGKYKGAMVSYEQASEIAQAAKITSATEYYRWYKDALQRIPASPPREYKNDWSCWNTFLGFKCKFASYEEAKEIVQQVGVKSHLEYKMWYTQSKIRLPAAPQVMYSEWTNWYDFLGKTNK